MLSNKNFYIFLLCHLIIWTLLPIIFRANLPMDSAEALVWGFIGEWGTNKHPPLSGFMANLIYQASCRPESLYVLSQLFVIGGLFYIYKLAKLFLPQTKAILAAAVLEGAAYYNLVTPEYNVNIIALMLWPAAVYYFVCGIRRNKLVDWLLFGLFAGLNILNKYVSGILLICLGLYLVLPKEGRTRLTSWKVWIGAGVAFALIAPHLWWLEAHDWFVIDYFLGRSGEGKVLPFGLAHLVYPFKFLASQAMTGALALLILIGARYKSGKDNIKISAADNRLIFYAGVLPLLLMALISLILGIKLKSMWGSPTLYMLGICFMVWKPFKVEKTAKKMFAACYGAMILFACAFALQASLTTSAKFKLNAADFTQKLEADKAAYVGGSVWLASTLSAYAPTHPAVLFLMSPKDNPWIDMADVQHKGILVADENLDAYLAYQREFKVFPGPKIYGVTVQTPLGKVKTYQLYYGTIAGEQK